MIKTFFKTTLFFTALLTAQLVFSQNEKPEKAMIISSTGLNFRAEPHSVAKIIYKIGYGEEVIVLERLKNTVFHLNHKYQRFQLQGKVEEVPVKGYWVKVKHEDKTGYLFSGYLSPVDYENYHKPPEGWNEDYLVLFPQSTCFFNFPKHNDWHWYGLLEKDGKTYFKAINPSFYVAEYEDWMVSACIFSNEKAYCYFIIGSKTPLPEYANWKENIDFQIGRQNIFSLSDDVKSTTLVEGLDIEWDNPKEKYHDFTMWMSDEKGGKRKFSTTEISDFPPYLFIWRGDLDGDGLKDYIMTLGDKFSKTILFLSSEAKDEAIVSPVAIYYNGYCC